MWDFETDQEYQSVLSWADDFVTNKVEPLDMVLGATKEYDDPDFIRQIRPLQHEVKERGLWACHLGPELGGLGFGQLKLALLNEHYLVAAGIETNSTITAGATFDTNLH